MEFMPRAQVLDILNHYTALIQEIEAELSDDQVCVDCELIATFRKRGTELYDRWSCAPLDPRDHLTLTEHHEIILKCLKWLVKMSQLTPEGCKDEV